MTTSGRVSDVVEKEFAGRQDNKAETVQSASASKLPSSGSLPNTSGPASPANLGPVAFIYKLNALEHAGSQINPSKHAYKEKRDAVLFHVSEIERELDDLRHDIERHVAALSAEVDESERLRKELAECQAQLEAERKAREEAERLSGTHERITAPVLGDGHKLGKKQGNGTDHPMGKHSGIG